jgi:hypothetical protein
MSGAQPLASACAACGEHLAATVGLEAMAKAVTALTHQLAGLIGPLHEVFSLAVACGLYGSPGWGVNATPFAPAGVAICVPYQGNGAHGSLRIPRSGGHDLAEATFDGHLGGEHVESAPRRLLETHEAA